MSRTYKDVSVKYAPHNDHKIKQRKTNIVDNKTAIEFELSAYDLTLANSSLSKLLKDLSDETI